MARDLGCDYTCTSQYWGGHDNFTCSVWLQGDWSQVEVEESGPGTWNGEALTFTTLSVSVVVLLSILWAENVT